MTDGTTVWVFTHREKVGGVFSSLQLAEQWIAKWSLTGLLSEYPLDAGAWDWAVANGRFTPRKDAHKAPGFIGSFGCAGTHHHYVDGVREA